MTAEVIDWIPVAERLPDSELTVLVAFDGADEPTWLGFHDGHVWHDACTGAEFVDRATHWAEMPAGPATGDTDDRG